ncbi:MAG: hypothetical protein ACON4Z_09550 [Planctomycetota bacterium]
MYFCAVGLIALLPFLYLFCQVFTVVLYRGAWRWWCLLPLPVVVAVASLLFWFQTPVAFVVILIAAPSAGMLALACVWAAYSRSGPKPAAADGAQQVAENGGLRG